MRGHPGFLQSEGVKLSELTRLWGSSLAQPDPVLTHISSFARQVQLDHIYSSILLLLSWVRRQSLKKTKERCQTLPRSSHTLPSVQPLHFHSPEVCVHLWVVPSDACGPWFCNFLIWQSPSFVDFFFLLKKDVGFSEKFICGFFESDKQVNCILVNNRYQKTVFLISKKLIPFLSFPVPF